MIKIKDFTLASQNLGGARAPPPVPYTPGAHAPKLKANGCYGCRWRTEK